MGSVFLINAIPYCVAFIVGATVGSFLNVVAYRLPKIIYDIEYQNISDFLIDESKNKARFLSGIAFIDRLLNRKDIESILAKKSILPAKGFWYLAIPGSSCPNCGHVIKFYENIPIFGWLLLRGKCAGCKNAISPQYPLVELMTAILTALVVFVLGFTYEALCYIVFVWVLISLTLIDLKFYLLPDCLTSPMVWLGLIFSYFGVISLDFQSAFLGAIIGYLSLWLINKIALIILKKDGIGAGDFKLLAMIGAWQGVGNLFNVIFISSIVGAVVGAIILINKQKKDNYIPYGPFLALASMIVLLFNLQADSFIGL